MASKLKSFTKIKSIKRKGREDKSTRSSLKKRASKTRVSDGTPTDREGKEGEFTLRLVEGKVKLYAKFRRKWYSIELA